MPTSTGITMMKMIEPLPEPLQEIALELWACSMEILLRGFG